jgi:hypothetical protein
VSRLADADSRLIDPQLQLSVIPSEASVIPSEASVIPSEARDLLSRQSGQMNFSARKRQKLIEKSGLALWVIENQSAVIMRLLLFPCQQTSPLSGRQIPRCARDDSLVGMTALSG